MWRWGSYLPAKSVEVKDGVLRLTREENPGKIDSFEAKLGGRDALKGPESAIPDGLRSITARASGRRRCSTAKAPAWGRARHALRRQDAHRLEALRDPQKKNGWSRAERRRLVVVEPKDNADPRDRADLPGPEAARRVQRGRQEQQRRLHLRGAATRSRILDNPDAKMAARLHWLRRSLQPRGAEARRGKPGRRAVRACDCRQPVGRQLQVVLNGKCGPADTVVEGIARRRPQIPSRGGGPGPLRMLQGDHGKVKFRNIVAVTPGRQREREPLQQQISRRASHSGSSRSRAVLRTEGRAPSGVLGEGASSMLLQITVLPYVAGSLIYGFGSLGARRRGSSSRAAAPC